MLLYKIEMKERGEKKTVNFKLKINIYFISDNKIKNTHKTQTVKIFFFEEN